MKRANQNMGMTVDHLDYYPSRVPPASSPGVVFTVSKVVLTGTSPRLEYYWQKALTDVVGWRVARVMVANPAFGGDVNPFYIVTSNLPSPSPNEGRLNSDIRQILAVVLRPNNPGTVNTLQEFPVDATTWTRIKNYLEIDNIWVELLGSNGNTFVSGTSIAWTVELEFLCSVYEQ